MKELLFGPAGIPVGCKGDTLAGISHTKAIGLDCMELEFVRSINITKEKAPFVKEVSQKEDVLLTCHAPYYINLNAKEPQKVHASMGRIEKSAHILDMCGGWSVCFHPGFYLRMDPDKVYENIKENLQKIRSRLDEDSVDVWIRPETTGKPSQFGNLKELLGISQETEGVMPVIDWSHLHARSGGDYNTEEEFREVLDMVEEYTGREGLDNMHMHLSGIAYSDKGERNHLILEESDMNYRPLMEVWKDYDIKGVVISESPNIEKDALLMQQHYKRC